jgi:Lipocalin-like domain
MRTIMALVALATAVFAHEPSHGQPSDPVLSQLLGTWKLVALVREEVDTGTKTELMGANAIGQLMFAADGRMSTFTIRSDRRKPAGETATAEEAAALFKSMVSYIGTYTLSEGKITYAIDASWNESWTGTKQVRLFKFEGNRMHISTPPSRDPIDGKMSVRYQVWEKVK